MKQYAIYFQGQPVEYTGYFKNVSAVRTYLRLRYGSPAGLTFKAVYPVVETKVYTV